MGKVKLSTYIVKLKLYLRYYYSMYMKYSKDTFITLQRKGIMPNVNRVVTTDTN